ncbi:MAG: zinc-dependent peptidase [Sulfurifustis sp.]
MKWKIFSRRPPPLDPQHWAHALTLCPYARQLPPGDRDRLHEVAQAFLHIKRFEGAADFEPTPVIRAVIAVKASVPILNLGLEYYDEWREIIVYPGDFRVDDEYVDDAGVMHRETRDLCGQSLTQGPMVLSWQTIEEEREALDRDVVIHECAHKLDILNGDANGFPPLHSDMQTARWTKTFADAFERFGADVDADFETGLDPYGAADPAEFFAVLSETFFTAPAIVARDFPAVYRQLARFYRQDPRRVLRASP